MAQCSPCPSWARQNSYSTITEHNSVAPCVVNSPHTPNTANCAQHQPPPAPLLTIARSILTRRHHQTTNQPRSNTQPKQRLYVCIRVESPNVALQEAPVEVAAHCVVDEPPRGLNLPARLVLEHHILVPPGGGCASGHGGCVWNDSGGRGSSIDSSSRREHGKQPWGWCLKEGVFINSVVLLAVCWLGTTLQLPVNTSTSQPLQRPTHSASLPPSISHLRFTPKSTSPAAMSGLPPSTSARIASCRLASSSAAFLSASAARSARMRSSSAFNSASSSESSSCCC